MAQITFWIKGGGTYHIENKSWTFTAPAVSFVSSGVVHGFSVSKSADAIVLSVADDALKTIFAQNESARNLTCFVQKAGNKTDRDNLGLLMK